MDQSFAISGYSLSGMLTCVVDGCDIYQADYMGNRKMIGKTVDAYKELEETTKQYYDKLVELGVIVPEKTPEQMMAEMQGTMLEMSKIISSLSNEVKELKASGSEQRVEHGESDVPQRKPVRSGGKGAASDQRDNG